jgi:hypothetical protein
VPGRHPELIFRLEANGRMWWLYDITRSLMGDEDGLTYEKPSNRKLILIYGVKPLSDHKSFLTAGKGSNNTIDIIGKEGRRGEEVLLSKLAI